MLLKLVSKLIQEVASYELGDVLPDMCSIRSSFDRQVDIFDATTGALRDKLSCTRVDDIKSFSTLGVAPLTVDKKLVSDGVGLIWDSF